MDAPALITLICAWSVIIFFTVYFMAKALKTQHNHNVED